MTYNVFGGTLKPCSINSRKLLYWHVVEKPATAYFVWTIDHWQTFTTAPRSTNCFKEEAELAVTLTLNRCRRRKFTKLCSCGSYEFYTVQDCNPVFSVLL